MEGAEKRKKKRLYEPTTKKKTATKVVLVEKNVVRLRFSVKFSSDLSKPIYLFIFGGVNYGYRDSFVLIYLGRRDRSSISTLPTDFILLGE